MTLDQHACGGDLDASDLRSMRGAYAIAREILSSSTVALDAAGQKDLDDLLAKAVLSAARTGERDVERLSSRALDLVGTYCRAWGHLGASWRQGLQRAAHPTFVIDLADYRRAKARTYHSEIGVDTAYYHEAAIRDEKALKIGRSAVTSSSAASIVDEAASACTTTS